MEPILAALEQAASSELIPPGTALLIAVSGGADSLALLYASVEAREATGWTLSVAHVHHGWRGREADRDLAFVRDHARRLGIPVFSRWCDAREKARAWKLSPEAAARQVRYVALFEMRREAGAGLIATAHHADDRLESYLLARRRRGGVAALGGPRRLRTDGVVRPLLDVSREELLEFVRRRGLTWRRDASNGDLSLARNRVRRQIAEMRTGESRRAFEELAARADAAAAERDRVERELDQRLRRQLHVGAEAALADAAALAAASRDVQRLAIAELSSPFARPGRPALTGREREQVLDRLAAGADFRFEAGRRVRFQRRGPLLTVGVRPDARPV